MKKWQIIESKTKVIRKIIVKKMARPLRPGSGLRAPSLPVVRENQVLTVMMITMMLNKVMTMMMMAMMEVG